MEDGPGRGEILLRVNYATLAGMKNFMGNGFQIGIVARGIPDYLVENDGFKGILSNQILNKKFSIVLFSEKHSWM